METTTDSLIGKLESLKNSPDDSNRAQHSEIYAANDAIDNCIAFIRQHTASPQVVRLLEAANAVVERWDSPAWKELPHTGESIARLRSAIAAMGERSNPAPEHAASPIEDSPASDPYDDFGGKPGTAEPQASEISSLKPGWFKEQVALAEKDVEAWPDYMKGDMLDKILEETPIPCDIKVGATRFRKGVSLAVFVRAAQRWFGDAHRQYLSETKPVSLAHCAKALHSYELQTLYTDSIGKTKAVLNAAGVAYVD